MLSPTRPLRAERAELSPRAVGTTVDHDFFVVFDVRVADEESLPAGRDLVLSLSALDALESDLGCPHASSIISEPVMSREEFFAA